MDALTCLKKLEYVGVLNFATVDEDGNPQVRNISAIHYEEDALYFFTARGKNFCKQLINDGRVQISGYTRYKESIRLSGKAFVVDDEKQKYYRDLIFKEQPYLENVYPGNTKDIGIIFGIKGFIIEYFNLGVNPIFRETYQVGEYETKPKGYLITDSCISCGKCKNNCPQQAIDQGIPFNIRHENCLHCGNCYENCPVNAIKHLGV